MLFTHYLYSLRHFHYTPLLTDSQWQLHWDSQKSDSLLLIISQSIVYGILYIILYYMVGSTQRVLTTLGIWHKPLFTHIISVCVILASVTYLNSQTIHKPQCICMCVYDNYYLLSISCYVWQQDDFFAVSVLSGLITASTSLVTGAFCANMLLPAQQRHVNHSNVWITATCESQRHVNHSAV